MAVYVPCLTLVSQVNSPVLESCVTPVGKLALCHVTAWDACEGSTKAEYEVLFPAIPETILIAELPLIVTLDGARWLTVKVIVWFSILILPSI